MLKKLLTKLLKAAIKLLAVLAVLVFVRSIFSGEWRVALGLFLLYQGLKFLGWLFSDDD